MKGLCPGPPEPQHGNYCLEREKEEEGIERSEGCSRTRKRRRKRREGEEGLRGKEDMQR